MGQVLVIILDKLADLGIEVIDGGEVSSANHFAGQRAKPDLDLIKPGGVGRREVEYDTLVGATEESTTLSPSVERRQWTATQLGYHLAGFLVPVGVEVVENEVDTFGLAVMMAHRLDEVGEDLSRTVVGQVTVDLSRGHLQAGGQAPGAVANVLMLDPLDASTSARLVRESALQRLDAGLLVDRQDDFSTLFQCLGLEVKGDDVQHLGLELRVGAVEPVMPAMRLDGGLVEKTPDRAPADGLNDAAHDGGSSEVGGAPMRERNAILSRRPSGQGHNLVLLLRGKTAAVGRDEDDR